MTTSDPRDQFAAFIAVLFSPDDIVEVRAIDCRDLPEGTPKLSSQQWWHAAKDLTAKFDALAIANDAGRAIYIGANPRIKKRGAKAEDVFLARAFVVDFDGGTMPDDALARIAGAVLPDPSIVVASGHGTHAYWLLAEPMTDMDLWRRHQKALIALLNTDPVIHDPPRIMRAPGFVNNKHEPHVPAELVEVHPDRRYGIDQFPAPEIMASPARSSFAAARVARVDRSGKIAAESCVENLSRATLQFLHSGAAEGTRNLRLFNAACDYQGCGILYEQAERELGEAAHRCGLQDREIKTTIMSAYSKARTSSRPVDAGVMTKARPKCGPPKKMAWDDDKNRDERSDPPSSSAPAVNLQRPLTEGAGVHAFPQPGDRLMFDPRDPLSIARKYLAQHHTHPEGHTLHHHHGEFVGWNGTRYTEVGNHEIRSRLYPFLELSSRITMTPSGAEHVAPFQPTRAKVDNVADALRAVTYLNSEVVGPAWIGIGANADPPPAELVAAQNGLVHIPTGRLIAHTPRFLSRHALPFAYDPAAPSPRHWRAFLEQLWPGDTESVYALQEWFGYSLTPDTRQQKVLLIVGPPRSGKGTIVRIWTALLGHWSVAAPTLASLETNFGLWPLIDKRLATISDARLSGRPDQAKIVERLLSISGQDVQTIDRKNLSPWTGRLDARIVILTNEVPRLADASGAMASRFIVLKLTESFLGREDTALEARLISEMSGILLWGMEGYRSLQARGRFIQPESASDTIQDLKDLSSPTAMFVAECCELGGSCRVRMLDLYQAWSAWCQQQGRDHAGTAQTFGRDLKAAVSGIGPRSNLLHAVLTLLLCSQGESA